MPVQTRSQLGTVVGAIIREIDGILNDPISEQCGIYGDTSKACYRVAAAHGWTMAQIEAELDARGVSEKWQYEELGFIPAENPDTDSYTFRNATN